MALAAESLYPIERALGIVVGEHHDVAALSAEHSRTVREALEDVIRRALLRQPCFVSFSGGRDSSALLAVAVSVARREGLPLPVPITLVFPHDASSQEGEWQRLVLDHLEVTDHEQVIVRGDLLDAVGPVAREVLGRHGLLWPFNTYCHQPMVAAASGGSLITGLGGDELALTSVGLWGERILAGKRRYRPRQLRAILAAKSPVAIRFARQLVGPSSVLDITPWLTPSGRRRARVALARAEAGTPFGWDRVLLEQHWRSRWVQVAVRSTAVMAAWYDTEVVHPFVAAPVLQALAAHAPTHGVGGRDQLMQYLFGDLVPNRAIHRRTKASFGDSLWSSTSHDFARDWSGRGLDDELVDAERIRSAWTDRTTSTFSASLMQQAWLAQQQDRPAVAAGL